MTLTSDPPAMTTTVVVAEVFGPTVQGEGPSTGRRAGFIRFGGCNLSCSWCDTKYTWDGASYDLRAELGRRPVTEVADRALTGRPELVVLTGGEPLLHQQQSGWSRLLHLLGEASVDIEIETNGTISPCPATLAHGVAFNVSPKLAHSDESERRRVRSRALDDLACTGAAVFKFVCANEAHVAEAAALARAHQIDRSTVWISPEGTDAEQVVAHTRAIADATVAHGFNLGTRLHNLAWGNERAR